MTTVSIAAAPKPTSARDGALRALPVVVAYLPLAFAYGAAARAAGVSLTATVLMSFIVYAGASQMIAVNLFAAGLPMMSVVLTTFLVNLRGLVLSLALAEKVRTWKRGLRFLFGLELTDETFALHSAPEAGRDLAPAASLAVNVSCQLAWCTGSLAGHLAGAVLPDTRVLGLDYALVAMFVGLLVPRLVTRLGALVAVMAGLLSLLCHRAGLASWAALLATVLAAALGAYLETSCRKKKSS